MRYIIRNRKGKQISVDAVEMTDAIEKIKAKHVFSVNWEKLKIISNESAIIGTPGNDDGYRITCEDWA